MATKSFGNRTALSPDMGKPKVGSRPSEGRLKQLMLEGLRGNRSAYDSLVRAIAPLLTSFFARRLRDGEVDSEDLTQETLLAMHNRSASFDRKQPFTPWMYAIARHKLVDYFRRRRLHSSIEELSETLRVEGFEETSNARIDIDRLLNRLSPKQARAIRQTRLRGLSVAEAAREAGLGESDVKVSVHRGVKALSLRVAFGAT